MEVSSCIDFNLIFFLFTQLKYFIFNRIDTNQNGHLIFICTFKTLFRTLIGPFVGGNREKQKKTTCGIRSRLLKLLEALRFRCLPARPIFFQGFEASSSYILVYTSSSSSAGSKTRLPSFKYVGTLQEN